MHSLPGRTRPLLFFLRYRPSPGQYPVPQDSPSLYFGILHVIAVSFLSRLRDFHLEISKLRHDSSRVVLFLRRPFLQSYDAERITALALMH